MNIINLFFCFCFVAHGFCDFLPLFKTLNKNVLINYIFGIFTCSYIHLINPSISTFIFIIISSMHFNQDFAPYNKLKFPSIGMYILSAPIIIDYDIYISYLDYIGVIYPKVLLTVMYIGGVLGIINSQTMKDEIYHVILYSILCIYSGIDALFMYMIYYHFGISLFLLINTYDMKKILILQGLGLVIMSFFYFVLYDLVIEMFHLYKDYLIGSLFGLLNSHSLTTLLWRQKEITLYD